MQPEADPSIKVVVCAFVGAEIYLGTWEIWITIPSWRWRDEAACRGAGAEIFVPERGTKTPRLVQLLCPICSVSETCEMVGRATRSEGWWGGVLLAPDPPPEPSVHRGKPPALTPEQAEEVCQRYEQGGVREKDLAAEFGVSRSTISRIRRDNAY